MSTTLMVYLRPSSLICCLYSSPPGPMYAFPHLGGSKPTPREAVFGRARYCRLVNRDRIGISSCQGGLEKSADVKPGLRRRQRRYREAIISPSRLDSYIQGKAWYCWYRLKDSWEIVSKKRNARDQQGQFHRQAAHCSSTHRSLVLSDSERCQLSG